MSLDRFSVESSLVPSPVEVAVLQPEGTTGPLPLLLFLHGGGGSADQLGQFREYFEEAWAAGTLAPVVVATPSCQRSAYLDTFDGKEKWETFLLDALLPALRERFPVQTSREGTLLSGISMGGMGGLRLAFKYPERFATVAVLEPGIEPSLSFAEVPLRDRLFREIEYMETRFGKPVSEEHWQANNPANVARANAGAIQESGLDIYFECGDEDALYLHHGAEFLHRVLWDAGIPHEYRSVRRGDHLGFSLIERFRHMLGFLARHLDPPPVDIPGAVIPLSSLHEQQAQSAKRQGYVPERRTLVNAGDALIDVTVRGEGPTVVLLPSLGRGAADFEDLAMRLAAAGYRTLCPEPRSLGGSTGAMNGLTLHDLAADIVPVIERFGGPAIVIGHAFGNRVARSVASDRPDLVGHVVLLACGGKVPPKPEIHAALMACFNPMLSPDERLRAVNAAFFAEGNDPAVWNFGWHPELARAQLRAGQSTAVDEWWPAGGKSMLVVQGMQDVTALPANAELLREQFPERVTVHELQGAGHAMLPEQPEAIAQAVLAWLAARET